MDELIANDASRVEALLGAVRGGGFLEPSAFARLTGTSEASVLHAWRDGSLPTERGAIPVREGVIALVSLGAFRRGKAVPGFLREADALAREQLGLPPRDDADGGKEQAVTDDELREWRLRYLKAQTAARAAAAASRQRENDVQKGRLVLRAEVELDAAECATNVARVLSQLPERTASMCVGCTAEEIAAILRKEILAAIDEIQAAAFVGNGAGDEFLER